jgi:HAMP domain-containing protein
LNTLKVDIDLPYYVDLENVDFSDAFNDICQMVEDGNGFDCEVIYYSDAIEYLAENDPSLRESCELAAEMGYEAGNLNSELLASLLKSQNVRTEFQELEDEINTFFEDLQDQLDELEEEEDEEDF